ncbi:MAG: ATPase [Lachnospiraceae bacterium]|nr:ATPase [Lachnospiraceae bacterium]
MASGIEEIIEEIEEYVDECKPSAFSPSKIIVNRDELESLLEELRTKTPEEIKRYQKIISNKEAILADAQNKADAIIAQAQIQTNELVSEHQIMQQAYAKANEIIMLATKNAQDMLDKATEDANSIRMGAITYTDDLLNTIESVISNSMETTQARTETFMQTMQGYLDIVVANRQELVPQEVAQPEPSVKQPQPVEPQETEETASDDNVPALDIPESFFNKE